MCINSSHCHMRPVNSATSSDASLHPSSLHGPSPPGVSCLQASCRPTPTVRTQTSCWWETRRTWPTSGRFRRNRPRSWPINTGVCAFAGVSVCVCVFANLVHRFSDAFALPTGSTVWFLQGWNLSAFLSSEHRVCLRGQTSRSSRSSLWLADWIIARKVKYTMIQCVSAKPEERE